MTKCFGAILAACLALTAVYALAQPAQKPKPIINPAPTAKDWADLEEMQLAGTLETDRVLTVIARHLGADDHRIERIRSIATNKF